MFAIPGIVSLIVFLYVRPQEYFDSLQSVPFLYIFCAVAVFGFAVDLRLGLTRMRWSPQLGLVVVDLGWSLFTLAANDPRSLPAQLPLSFITVFLCLIIALGVQTFRGLQVLGTTLVVLALFLAVVGVHQAHAPFGCIKLDERNLTDLTTNVPDGRPCETRYDCERDSPEPGAEYSCERVGLFGTTSVANGRIRYRGILQDPNELALAISIGAPFALAAFERRRSLPRLGLALATFGLVLVCDIYTQSRSGQLVFAAVIGAYFVRRLGWRGLVAGFLVSAPVLLLGGRQGIDAESSSLERLECWSAGLDMWRRSPIFGVGKGQFIEHHYLTAHNSFILALAETGLFGAFIWTSLVYVTFKIPITALRRLRGQPDARFADVAAMTILATLCGLMVGSFFLSFSPHNIFWIYLGLAGALYSALRTHDPTFRVRFGTRDALTVAAVVVCLIAAVFVYTRSQGV